MIPLAVLTLVATAALAQDLFRWPDGAPQAQPQGAGSASTTSATVQPVYADPVAQGLLNDWQQVRSSGLPFASYANFLLRHQGWPGEAQIRKNAERALRADADSPATVIAFFDRWPAETATGQLRLAEALAARGRGDGAREAARQAWRMGALSDLDESRLLGRWGSALTQADHDARMDRLLWQRATAAAQRQLLLTSSAARPVFATRLSLQARAPEAAQSLAAAATMVPMRDPGLLFDQVSYLRGQGDTSGARTLLAAPRQFEQAPTDPARWLSANYAVADDAADGGNWRDAYLIARQVRDAYPRETKVRERPLVERDAYTSLAWLGGVAALDRLGAPADAIPLFETYATAARTPQTQSKGLYWAGRAADAAGRREAAQGYYRRAAVFFDQFYGQLARERLGEPLTLPETDPPRVSAEDRGRYDAREIVRVTRYLGQTGDWTTQSLFLRAIAANADSDRDHALAYDLSARIGRPDLAVMVGRNAGVNGYRDIIRPGFPAVPLPSDMERDWLIVHAIARQESQFDRKIVSHAGARGLMQLMPGTARETAGKIGLSYSPASLDDPAYNMRLGAWYFGRLMDRYGGSYPLAIAAYNAGAGNVNKWLAQNGDPRVPGADMLRWIERIPFSETRGYVQRVLENMVVYGLVAPEHAHTRSATPLSTYLGKRTPG